MLNSMIGSPTIIMGVYLLSITNMLYQKKIDGCIICI